jgi:hypothetical protein
VVQICLPPPTSDISLTCDAEVRGFVEWWFDLGDEPEELVAVALDDERRVVAVTDFEEMASPDWLARTPHAAFLAAQATEAAFLVLASKRCTGRAALTPAERRARDALARFGELDGIEVLDWLVVCGRPARPGGGCDGDA